MSFSVKVTGYSKSDGTALVEMAPGWWNALDLIKDERFLESHRRGNCRDFVAELSPEEVRELHVRYRKDGSTMQKLLCFKLRKLSPSCKRLHDALFKRADSFSHFHVSIAEFESGL
ncbi:MAG: hypothetical protein ABW072_02105 [Sedimenticola sp.]